MRQSGNRWFVLFLAVAALPAPPVCAQDSVRVDMAAGWLRRDWKKCGDPTRFVQQGGAVTIESDHSSALFWQIPTRNGEPLEIDRSQKWVQECGRPPEDFGKTVLRQDSDGRTLLEVSDYRYVTWRWKVDKTTDDRNTADDRGRIRKEGDDFAAKLGISILRKNSDDLREIAYVWTRTIPRGTQLSQETTIIPGIWKYKWYRLVAESGNANVGKWTPEVRDLYADYRRAYPGEEPGPIVRVYLMTDSDNTHDRVSGAFSSIEFHKTRPDSSAKK